MVLPHYDLDKIKFGTDPGTWERAVGLYEDKKIRNFKDIGFGWEATVQGTKPYSVWVDARHYDKGHCTCYLGETDVLCKHMVAVAIHVVTQGRALSEAEKTFVDTPVSSGRVGELSAQELRKVKAEITSALRYIKGYSGPSSTWWSYTMSLSEGCARLAKIVSDLPVSEQTAVLLVDLLLRLEKKVMGSGVDDSDGAVGSCMQGIVEVLLVFKSLDPRCASAFEKLRGLETSFGWEEPLLNR